ncbi:zinc finger protein 449-like [Diorhabda carinulata]|uniref:zinc finger protein 449-like n=1 Tax=Diorhabda carinulata TaxID=1163345 RepID=UPI0025A1CE30|nr:zinc finger protein 449-like [Diorhabda carinulata]
MERYTCRTCLSIADVDESLEILEKYFPKKTIKDVLLQYVPQMENSLSDSDRICVICFQTLKNFVEFIDKCIEIEEHLKNNEDVIEEIEDNNDSTIENIHIVLDDDLKPCFGDVVSRGKPITVSVDHDHSYIKFDSTNKTLDTSSINCKEDTSNHVYDQEDSFDGIGNLKFIPVATVSDDMLDGQFIEACSSQAHNELHPNITILATGDELIDSAIIQIKEESNGESSDDIEQMEYQSIDEKPTTCACEFCGVEFISEYVLKEHYLTHGEVRLMCDKCPKIFKNDSALKAHYRLKHMEVERFKCDICDQVFGRADYLRNHRKRHEDDNQRDRDNVKCRVPGKFLRFKNTDDPLPCKICGKYYNGIQKLKVHLQTHLVVKRFACKYCDLTYKRWPSLKRHEKTHLEADTFFHRCNVCWKRFYTKEELEFHMTQHGNPRYRCQVCDEQFHRKYLFDNHYLLKHATLEDIENSKKEVIYDTLLELSNQNLLVPNKTDE